MFSFNPTIQEEGKGRKWLTRTLNISIKYKERLYHTELNNPTDSNILKYKQHRSRLDFCLKRVMEVYHYETFSEIKLSATNVELFGTAIQSK